MECCLVRQQVEVWLECNLPLCFSSCESRIGICAPVSCSQYLDREAAWSGEAEPRSPVTLVQLLRNIERSEARIPDGVASSLSDACISMIRLLLRRNPGTDCCCQSLQKSDWTL